MFSVKKDKKFCVVVIDYYFLCGFDVIYFNFVLYGFWCELEIFVLMVRMSFNENILFEFKFLVNNIYIVFLGSELFNDWIVNVFGLLGKVRKVVFDEGFFFFVG